ncbi:hypothetical protein RHGRI_002210 [Rhododendron griersonianum]|uniref:Uncharacterized protein n=1 Tax=Rhododendron griersonianum TaxID=479676 RepID=A0AAV6LRZ0_9ERIC|nr:hypothetical protein RHGRI_002210 [Rhododendron griersonianum]
MHTFEKLVHLFYLLLLTLTFFPSSIAYPKDLSTLRYNRVYRNSSVVEKLGEGYELGTRISYDVPDHVPNICDECQKPNGNCGVGLRCICHPRECKNQVTSKSGNIDPFGNILFSLLSSILVIFIFMEPLEIKHLQEVDSVPQGSPDTTALDDQKQAAF